MMFLHCVEIGYCYAAPEKNNSQKHQKQNIKKSLIPVSSTYVEAHKSEGNQGAPHLGIHQNWQNWTQTCFLTPTLNQKKRIWYGSYELQAVLVRKVFVLYPIQPVQPSFSIKFVISQYFYRLICVCKLVIIDRKLRENREILG